MTPQPSCTLTQSIVKIWPQVDYLTCPEDSFTLAQLLCLVSPLRASGLPHSRLHFSFSFLCPQHSDGEDHPHGNCPYIYVIPVLNLKWCRSRIKSFPSHIKPRCSPLWPYMYFCLEISMNDIIHFRLWVTVSNGFSICIEFGSKLIIRCYHPTISRPSNFSPHELSNSFESALVPNNGYCTYIWTLTVVRLDTDLPLL